MDADKVTWTENGVWEDKKSMDIGSTYVATAAAFGNNRVIKLGEQLVIKKVTDYIGIQGGYKDKQVIFTDGTFVGLELFKNSFEEVR